MQVVAAVLALEAVASVLTVPVLTMLSLREVLELNMEPYFPTDFEGEVETIVDAEAIERFRGNESELDITDRPAADINDGTGDADMLLCAGHSFDSVLETQLHGLRLLPLGADADVEAGEGVDKAGMVPAVAASFSASSLHAPGPWTGISSKSCTVLIARFGRPSPWMHSCSSLTSQLFVSPSSRLLFRERISEEVERVRTKGHATSIRVVAMRKVLLSSSENRSGCLHGIERLGVQVFMLQVKQDESE